MGFAVLAVGIVVFALWGLKNPFAGLMGLVLANIIQPGEIYPFFNAIHVERLFFLILAVSTLLHNYRVGFPKITRTILVLLAVMLWSIPFSMWRGNTVTMVITFSVIVAYHILIVTLVKTETQFKVLIATFVAGVFWLAASSTYSYYQGQLFFAQGIERAVGLTSSGNNPNSLGITLVSALPLCALMVLDKSSKLLRLFGLVVGLASIWAVVITGSRTAFVAMCFLLLLALFTRKKNLIYLPVIAGVLVVAWSLVPAQYVQRYESVGELQKDESYQNRLLAWRAGVSMFLDRPLTGVGAGNFAIAAGEEYWPGTGRKHWLNAHSLFFQIIGELGLPGLIAFLVFLVAFFRLNLRLNKELKESSLSFTLRGFPLACILSLMVLLVCSYAGHTLYRQTWYVFAAFAGVLEAIAAKQGINGTEKDPRETEAALGEDGVGVGSIRETV